MAEPRLKGGVGAAIPHDSAYLHVSGEATYTDDIPEVRGTLYANFPVGKRQTYEKLDYFDERYYVCAADPDLSLKAWNAGLQIVPAYDAMIDHDEADDDRKLAAYNTEWHPAARLVNLAPARRKEAAAAVAKALGEQPALPSTVITDGSGRFLAAQQGVPTVSTLRKMLALHL